MGARKVVGLKQNRVFIPKVGQILVNNSEVIIDTIRVTGPVPYGWRPTWDAGWYCSERSYIWKSRPQKYSEHRAWLEFNPYDKTVSISFEVSKFLFNRDLFQRSHFIADRLLKRIALVLEDMQVPHRGIFPEDWWVSRVDVCRNFCASRQSAIWLTKIIREIPSTDSRVLILRDDECNYDAPYLSRASTVDRSGIVIYHSVKDGQPILRIEARYRRIRKLQRMIAKAPNDLIPQDRLQLQVFLNHPELWDFLYNEGLRKFGIRPGELIYMGGSDRFRTQIGRLARIHPETKEELRRFARDGPFDVTATDETRNCLNKFRMKCGGIPAVGLDGSYDLHTSWMFAH